MQLRTPHTSTGADSDGDPLVELFHQAWELDGEARSQFLESACGGNPDLRRVVETLLASSAIAEFNPGWEEPAIVQITRRRYWPDTPG